MLVFAGRTGLKEAAADGNPFVSLRGHVGVVVNNHFGVCLKSHAIDGFSLVWWGHPCVGGLFGTGHKLVLLAGKEVQYGHVALGVVASPTEHVRGVFWESNRTGGRSSGVIWCLGMCHFAPWWVTVAYVGLLSLEASKSVGGGTLSVV